LKDWQNTTNPPHKANPAVFPASNCQGCHNFDSWLGAKFDHSTTRFLLTNGHANLPCASCHINNNYNLTIAPTDCGNSGCHLTTWQQTNNPPHPKAGPSFAAANCANCHSLYGSLGQSKTTSDKQSSLNDSFGLTFAKIKGTGLLFDAHYSKFNSNFLSKNPTETVHLQLLGGYQKFSSPLSSNTNAKFVNGTLDWSLGHRFFMEGLFGWYQGTTMNYLQWSTVLGYRFGGLRR
jgi:hypothetical protein